jgi:hypothetical protein
MNVLVIVSPPLSRAFMKCRRLLLVGRSRNGSKGSLSLFLRDVRADGSLIAKESVLAQLERRGASVPTKGHRRSDSSVRGHAAHLDEDAHRFASDLTSCAIVVDLPRLGEVPLTSASTMPIEVRLLPNRIRRRVCPALVGLLQASSVGAVA